MLRLTCFPLESRFQSYLGSKENVECRSNQMIESYLQYSLILGGLPKIVFESHSALTTQYYNLAWWLCLSCAADHTEWKCIFKLLVCLFVCVSVALVTVSLPVPKTVLSSEVPNTVLSFTGFFLVFFSLHSFH